MLWLMLSSLAKGFSGFLIGSGRFYYLSVVTTFLAILSSFPIVALLLEALVLVEIIDWLAIARGKT